MKMIALLILSPLNLRQLHGGMVWTLSDVPNMSKTTLNTFTQWLP
jgi:hypothetical protein